MWTIHEVIKANCIGYVARHPTSGESPWYVDKWDLAAWFVETGRADTLAEAMRWIATHTRPLEVA
jgi:hypothetical protein